MHVLISDGDTTQRRSIEMVDMSVAQNTSEPHSNDPPIEDEQSSLASKFAPILAPLSTERVLDFALFFIAVTKVITILASSAKTEMMLPCLLAMSYSASS